MCRWKGSERSVTEHIHAGPGRPPAWGVVARPPASDKSRPRRVLRSLPFLGCWAWNCHRAEGFLRDTEARPADLCCLCFQHLRSSSRNQAPSLLNSGSSPCPTGLPPLPPGVRMEPGAELPCQGPGLCPQGKGDWVGTQS